MNRRQIKVIVNGKPYEVEVGELSVSPTTVKVNGKDYEVILPQDEDSHEGGTPEVEPRVLERHVEQPQVAQTTRRDAPSRLENGNDVRSPMPGTILNITVTPGQKVSRGDQICALEAMKMKSAIRAPKDGVIGSIEVSEGQKVVFGDILVRYA